MRSNIPGAAANCLIGFLVAMAVLAPLFFGYFLISVEAERYQAFASLPLYLILFFLMQFAAYRARRYRLTRTVWRGVRFWMTGSGWAYAMRSFLWTLLTMITLGLAYPWREAALERYKMRHTFYGDLQGRFAGTGWGLFKSRDRALDHWSGRHRRDHRHRRRSRSGVHRRRACRRAGPEGAAWRGARAVPDHGWRCSGRSTRRSNGAGGRLGIRFGDVTFESAFPRTKVLVLYLRYIAYVFFAGILVGIVIFAAAMGLRGVVSPDFMDTAKYDVIALAVLGYLLVLLGLGVAYRYFLQHQLWRALVDTLTIRNLEVTAGAVASGQKVNALGEGLLDGLDVAGF